ncbi:24360_t:CDS:2 [Dentiscutata erythropus]|uniref:24360_t:CDS:1 n=1 Tax=Dentiscutata erythropus TaxID=1348616 RepID=A0A9N9GT50_9GLOM|nr:24360_t:CDS:2 [Dentiscutata erythropus]
MNSILSLFKSYNCNVNESTATIQEKPEDVIVIIHVDDTEEEHDAGDINPDMSLSEVRKLLEHKNDIYMGENMKFLAIKNNIQAQIGFDKEEIYKVSRILDKDNCIHILKDATKPSFFHFTNKHHLIRGRYFTPNSMEVKIAQQDAFKFKTNRKISSRLELSNNECLTAYSETCKEEVERILVKHLISKANASVPLAPYSLKFGINFEKFDNKKQQASDSYEFKVAKCMKCSIIIMRDEIELTEEFKDAINNALDQEDEDLRLNELNKLSEKFGDFFPLETEFGGIIQYQVDSNSNTSASSKKNQVGSNIQDISLSYNSESNSSASKYRTNENYVIIGGDTHECKNINIENIENQKDWLQSLKDCDKWGLINYSKIISIYELLDDELRLKFLRAFGQKLLHYNTIEVTFNETNITNRKEREIPVPTDILTNMKENKDNYQIYATVLHAEEDIREVFSVHIEYFSSTNPCLVIQCVKKGESVKLRFLKSKEYKVKVAWMIIGFYSNFNFKPSLLKLKSCTLINPRQKFYNNRDLMIPMKILTEAFQKYSNHIIIELIVFLEHARFGIKMVKIMKVLGLLPEFTFAKMIIEVGSHDEKKQVDICQKHLEIYCCIITEDSDTLVEPKEVVWEKWENRGKNTIYKGKEWDKFTKDDEQKLIFASLLYEKNNRVNQCSPVFVNVNPKRPIILSFKEDKKNHTSFLTCCRL